MIHTENGVMAKLANISEMFLDVGGMSGMLGCCTRHTHNLDAQGRIPAPYHFGRCKGLQNNKLPKLVLCRLSDL